MCGKEYYIAATSIFAQDGTVHVQKGECEVTALK